MTFQWEHGFTCMQSKWFGNREILGKLNLNKITLITERLFDNLPFNKFPESIVKIQYNFPSAFSVLEVALY